MTVILIFPVQAQIVALGASNTAGQGVGTAQAFPAQLEAMLKAKGINMSVTNAGVSGDTAAGMLSRLDSAVPAGTKIVILLYGGNDARKGTGATRPANIPGSQSRLRTRNIKWLVADGLVASALRAGLKQADGIHLTIEGHRQVAAGLVGMVH